MIGDWFRTLWCTTFHDQSRKVLVSTRTYGQKVRCNMCGREWWED